MNPAYRPMLATLVDEPFDDKKWVFEIKWDLCGAHRVGLHDHLSLKSRDELVAMREAGGAHPVRSLRAPEWSRLKNALRRFITIKLSTSYGLHHDSMIGCAPLKDDSDCQ
jgi:hypothetical protein